MPARKKSSVDEELDALFSAAENEPADAGAGSTGDAALDTLFHEAEKEAAPPPKPEPLPPTSAGGAAARNLFSGFFGGFGGDLHGSAAYLLSGGDDQAFFNIRNEARKQEDADSKAHPVISTASEIVGGIPLALSPTKALGMVGAMGKGGAAAARAARASRLAKLAEKSKIVRGALTAAPVGAISGAGHARGDKLQGAIDGGLFSAALGGVLGAPSDLVKAFGSTRAGKHVAELIRGRANVAEAENAIHAAKKTIGKNQRVALTQQMKSPKNEGIEAARGRLRDLERKFADLAESGAKDKALKAAEKAVKNQKRVVKGLMRGRALEPGILEPNRAKGFADLDRKLATGTRDEAKEVLADLPGADLMEFVGTRGGGQVGAFTVGAAAASGNVPLALLAAGGRFGVQQLMKSPKALRAIADRLDPATVKAIEGARVFAQDGSPEGMAMAARMLQKAGLSAQDAKSAVVGAFGIQAGRAASE